jgi:hypothetical protein
MGQKQSCYKVQQPEQIAPSSHLYTLYFICTTLPVFKKDNPIDKILYAEDWCTQELVWRNYIQNAFREIEEQQLHTPNASKKLKISRMRVFTRVQGNVIMGSVRWISKDVDIVMLNETIKIDNLDLFEKGLYFVEPFWTTSIAPYLITKAAVTG